MTAPARSPILFPAFVRQYSIELGPHSGSALARSGLVLPTSLRSAVEKRQHEFLAGRHCAAHALRSIAPELATHPIGIGSNREPLCPPGIVGSITHANSYASAAVCRASDASGLGLDVESLMAADIAASVQNTIGTADEFQALVSETSWNMPSLVTLVFSAKETLFKCIYPRVRRYFDFLDVVVTAIDLVQNRLSIRLRSSLTRELAAGFQLEARFEVGATSVATGMLLPAGMDTP